MKKIIDGKMYNTETAKEIGSWYTAGIGSGDFNYIEETLYLKKTGEFFLYGKGGANTSYSVPVGNNSFGGGSQIIPFTPTQAREWAEKHLTADEYIEIFGEVEE